MVYLQGTQLSAGLGARGGSAAQAPAPPYLSFLSMRMQPSMISFSSGTFTL